MDQKPWLTPYHYCSNNPVGKVDPSGMLDGDYFDLQGNYLGNDGIYDGKEYIVTDNNEVCAILKNTSESKTTNLKDVKSAIDLMASQESRAEIIDRIKECGYANPYREYGGVVRKNLYGFGDFVDWGAPGNQVMPWDLTAEFNPNTCGGMGTYILFFHSHPFGEIQNIEQKCFSFNQFPSKADMNNANDPIRVKALNIQLSIQNELVNIYNSNGYISISFDVFRNIKNIHTNRGN